MGAALGLFCGIGLLLIWQATADPGGARSRPMTSVGSRVDELLRRAGIESVTPLGLVSLCVLAGFAALLVMLAVSRTLPIAAAFAVIAGYAPVALVRGRAQRRQRELAEVWPEA